MATKAKEGLTAEEKLAMLEAREAELAAKEAAFKEMVAGQQGGSTAPEVDPLIAINAALEEKVEIKLFKDSRDYTEPLFVNVNGDAVLIPRGVKVLVKKKHIKVIDASEAQDQETAILMEELQKEYNESLKKIT